MKFRLLFFLGYFRVLVLMFVDLYIVFCLIFFVIKLKLIIMDYFFIVYIIYNSLCLKLKKEILLVIG